jgi:hypothetical protein
MWKGKESKIRQNEIERKKERKNIYLSSGYTTCVRVNIIGQKYSQWALVEMLSMCYGEEEKVFRKKVRRVTGKRKVRQIEKSTAF